MIKKKVNKIDNIVAHRKMDHDVLSAMSGTAGSK